MARQARRAATLVPGASLRGLVFDVCFQNRIPHTYGMLNHFGMPNRNRVLVSESPDLDVAGLATALRISEEEVQLRRYPLSEKGHRKFFGLDVLKSRIEDRVRRFSPAAISEGHRYHPATHELRDLPFSTIGWDMLQDTCPCEEKGIKQNWVTSNGSDRCHACAGDLGKLPSVAVPEEWKPQLQFIAKLVDPDPASHEIARSMLPAAIRQTRRNLLYDVVMSAARAISDGKPGANTISRTEAIAKACEAAMLWPNGLHLIERSVECRTNAWDRVRRAYTLLDCIGDDPTPAPDTKAAQDAPAAPRYHPSGAIGRLRSPYISAMEAARLSGVDEPALKQAWDEGKFTQHRWAQGSLRIRAFDPAEVVALAPKLRVVGCRTIVANELGLPLYGLEQLLEASVIAPDAPSSQAKQLEVHRAAARSFVAGVEQRAASVVGARISFRDAIRHVSGRPKPWGAAFSAMLAGNLTFELVADAKQRAVVDRILVDRRAITSFVAMDHDLQIDTQIERCQWWSGTDALECLNGNRSAYDLLSGLDSQGGGMRKRYSVEQILKRAATGVTTFDLTRRTGVATTRVAALLEKRGVPQIAPGLWDRCQAEALLVT